MHYDRQREEQKQEILKKENTAVCREQILDMLKEVLSDTMKVFDFGAKKHPDSASIPNFLTPEGNKCDLKTRGKSVLGHAASGFCHPEALDEESGLPHLLHLISSAAILYIRHKRNIKHPIDQKQTIKTKKNLGLCGWAYVGESNDRSNENV